MNIMMGIYMMPYWFLVTEIEEKIIDKIPDMNGKILVYCRSGNSSATASITLINMGYTDVYDNDWEYETVKD